MEQKKYWQSFGELNNSEAYQQSSKDEFQEELNIPFEDSKGLFKGVTPRRDFLKYLGFSTAAAAVAASCEIPVKKAIPFANKPEDIVPGVANYYATTYVQDGDVVSVLAKVRDGRPIKLEGNEMSPLTGGGTSARVQASVLELYDTARLRFPTIDGKEATFNDIDKAIGSDLAGLGGAPVVLLTSTVTSPTTKEAIAQFLAKYPGSRHVVYDAVSATGILLANEATYGKRAIPNYRFDNAKVIVSLGADFLGTWLGGSNEYSLQYVKGRKLTDKKLDMNKHYQFESMMSLTGSNSDERFLHRPSEANAVTLALLSAVNGQGANGITDAKLKAGIEKAARDLLANKGAALVVSGSNDVNVQIVVNAINEVLQSGGKTIDWSSTVNYRQGVDSDFAKLVDDLNAGTVGGLLIYGANPAYTWYDTKKFISGLQKVRVKVSFNPKADETTQLVKYVIPDHHFLESWGDAEPKSGYISLMQPTISPLFKTRQWQDSLLKWAGATADYLGFVKQYWIGKLGSESAWDKALQDGVVNPATEPAATAATFNAAGVAAASAALGSAVRKGKYELVIYEKTGIGVNGAANPWLQELPDPVTRATWDNYAVISPALAKSLLGIDLARNGDSDSYEVHPDKPVIKITANGKEITLPAVIIPGTQPDTIAIAIGYGRTEKMGKAVVGSGKDAFPFTSYNGASVVNTVTDVTVAEVKGETYRIAMTQTHGVYATPQGVRTEVIKEMPLSEYQKHPSVILEEREEELKPFGGVADFEKKGTIYTYHDKPGIHWGMSIDMNSCFGCGACVVACHAENNVPVVGKAEVARFHDMHWLRIDRYYSGDMENPNVVFQPMMCQHCDNAPCENVCPVDATPHSSEGMNMMAYNRCVGTRYCANNCPYKVRRFNWADFMGADSFPNNQDELSDVVLMMNDELTRMVLNPDVTVRSRGVMEKCSFCVQRTQEGKLTAKKEGRPLKSGENNEWDVKTACQQACSTNAIVFGNINDTKSAVSVTRAENHYRLYRTLEEIHTLPNVTYLAKVRNQDEMEEKAEKGAKAETKKEA
ncbi:TAT-variant-translocated molybdopterin oxidoreductase [Deminuibacter soli]|uniref:4Fe-4S dicluster domain-containing protein n=1 Tax=Deminuibacter soli TaxID=2291815 RepID=A0A3E1NR11_9BACT|nr:TAT-variant-translocated molybdopterin oxidoreductase [Deminuibacter soli]RFM30371.1 4Fe-4S dicluster domain-containing protein [Deminuibacter soli]